MLFSFPAYNKNSDFKNKIEKLQEMTKRNEKHYAMSKQKILKPIQFLLLRKKLFQSSLSALRDKLFIKDSLNDSQMQTFNKDFQQRETSH